MAAAQVVESRREQEADPGMVAAIQVLTGGLGLTFAACIWGEPLPTLGAAGLAGWLWLVGPCTVVGLPAWLWVLRRLPVHVSMLQGTVSPVVAVGLSVVLGMQALGPGEALGALVVLGASSRVARA